jgi:hypothetical protein
MHFNESVRISDGVRLNHPNIRRSPVTQPTLLCLFVIDFSVESHGCSIFSKMALRLLICHRSEFPNETRRRTPKRSLTPSRWLNRQKGEGDGFCLQILHV